MVEEDKVQFYDLHKNRIYPMIKKESETKSLWRKLFWTTARQSNKYKAGCVDIFEIYFYEAYIKLRGQTL
tara:strand:- start:5459 stop:5668 length:210 start_codon:yes stop_codon:yes gene_type:complete